MYRTIAVKASVRKCSIFLGLFFWVWKEAGSPTHEGLGTGLIGLDPGCAENAWNTIRIAAF